MYSDGVITTEFTGYYDNVEQEYVYPTVRQVAAIEFPDYALFSWDNAFEASGLTITTATCKDEDITIGNTISSVLSASLLNTDNYLDTADLEGREGQLYIGYTTGGSTTSVASNVLLYGGVNSAVVRVLHQSIDPPDENWVYINSQRILIYGTPYYMICETNTLPILSRVLVFTDQEKVTILYNPNTDIATIGSRVSQTITLPSGYIPYSIGRKGAKKIPDAYWTITDGEAIGIDVQLVPMGIFNVSNLYRNSGVCTIEAYDRMANQFQADATAWISSLSLFPQDIPGFISSLMSHLSMSYTISASAVNTSVLYSDNPFAGQVMTYRDVLHYMAEAIGCNVRIGRMGTVEFFTWDSTPVSTITPHTIINQSRDVSQYTVPQITSLTVYGLDGTSYTSGTPGQDYVILGNPLLPASNTTAIDDLLTLLSGIPSYNVTTFTDACADPRIDPGDFLTLEKSDGTTYLAPSMYQTLTWRSSCVTEYQATGNQVRKPPSQSDMNDYNNAVASNPDTIMSVIQDQGIPADWITDGTLSLTDGTLSTDLDENGLLFGGTGLRSTFFRAYSLHHNSGTSETSYTINLPVGLYIIVHGQHVAPNANAQGLQVLVIGTNNGSTPLITTLSGSGSDLTATTGTRSQITMGNSDGSQATLTWTVQGRGYRRLEMIRLN